MKSKSRRSNSLASSTHSSSSSSLNYLFIGRALVLQEFTPSPYDKNSLCLRVGDIIDVIDMNETGIWTGLLNRKLGTFKFIYVSVLEIFESSSKHSSSRKSSLQNLNTSVLSTASSSSSSYTRTSALRLNKSKSYEYFHSPAADFIVYCPAAPISNSLGLSKSTSALLLTSSSINTNSTSSEGSILQFRQVVSNNSFDSISDYLHLISNRSDLDIHKVCLKLFFFLYDLKFSAGCNQLYLAIIKIHPPFYYSMSLLKKIILFLQQLRRKETCFCSFWLFSRISILFLL